MSLTLHLGVVDIPYSDQQVATTIDIYNALKAGKPLSKTARRSSVTTGEVATFLEDRYHVMETFYEDKQPKIAELFADALAGEIESVMSGGEARPNLTLGAAMGEIKAMFSTFLTVGPPTEAESSGIPGVPTQAALDGVSHRLKHPYAKGNPRRPSFVDTGLYESSFIAWVTNA